MPQSILFYAFGNRMSAFLFSAFLLQVVIPILANEKNNINWPQVICQDVRNHVHILHSDLLVILEQVKGKTLLPLPIDSEKLESINFESETV